MNTNVSDVAFVVALHLLEGVGPSILSCLSIRLSPLSHCHADARSVRPKLDHEFSWFLALAGQAANSDFLVPKHKQQLFIWHGPSGGHSLHVEHCHTTSLLVAS